MDQSVELLLACPDCAVQMPARAAFCPGCGRRMEEPNAQSLEQAPKATGRVGFFPESIAGGLAYLTFVPAAIFLILDPYRQNRFVRFHSVQCLLLWVALLGFAGALRISAFLLFYVPVAGPLLIWVLMAVSSMGAFFLWVVLEIKALQGEIFKIPVLGDIADHYAEWL